MLPFDTASVITLGVAAACLALAARGGPIRLRLSLILLAALLIRVDPARQASLHIWDESFHAVVAKHLLAHPLVPTLYEQPVVAPAADDWMESGVWLHKPPLAMWLMALGMATAGTDAFAMRLPSVLLSTLGVLLTFVVGRRLFDQRVGLLAAGFQAVNGLLVGLASGRRVADHVDTALVTCVQLGILCAVMARAQTGRASVDRPGAGQHGMAWLAGAAMGAGLLAKSLPALLIAGVAAIWWLQTTGWTTTLARLVRLAAGAAVIAGPWAIYTYLAFPAEAAAASAYTLQHMVRVVEGQGGSAWSYVRDMPRFFGELIYVPLAWLLVRARGKPGGASFKVVAAWAVVPYVVFSLMPTKLPAFIALAAPALFLAQAAFWMRVRDARAATGAVGARWGLPVLLVLLVVLPARNLLQPTGVFERRDCLPPTTEQAMALDETLGPGDVVIYNMPHAREAMFYSRFPAYSRLPRAEEVEALHQRGARIVVFIPDGEHVEIPDSWRAERLPARVR